jgi:isopenicillin-N epimerase
MASASPDSTFNQPAADPRHWPLDPSVVFLNHGSFGSCLRIVLEHQRELRERLERQPVRFLVRELEALWDAARTTLAQFLGADPADLVFVPNATSGVNAVLRSLHFEPGDELLVTNHEYNACRNALNFAAEQARARVVMAAVPFPFKSAEQLIEPVLAAVTSRTRLVLLDHVSSQTGLVFPVERLVRTLAERGIDTLIDGAHAPGMLPLHLGELGATYYTGNCHKWLCAPKGAAFLHVRPDRQELIRPLVISHGGNSPRMDRSKFLIEFGWMGTGDPSAWLSVPEALRFMGTLLPGGWPEVMRHNRGLALAARRILCSALQIASPCPDEFIGSLASVPIWDAANAAPSKSPLYQDALQDQLLSEHSIEVPVIPWPAPPKRLLRISAQLYNSLPQYELLAKALRQEP